MSLIRLSQHPKYSLPENLRSQFHQLKQSCSGISGTAAETAEEQELVCTLCSGEQLLAAVELGIQEHSANLYGIYVDEGNRHAGLGSITLMHAFRKLSSLSVGKLHMECPEEFRPYFSRFGFVALSDQTSREGKIRMTQPCLKYFIETVPKAVQISGRLSGTIMQLGSDSHSYHFRSEQQYTDLHRMMLGQARKRIWILADSIHNPVLNNDETSQAFYRLIKTNPQAEVRILVANDKQGAGYYNPSIHVAQRLSSYVEVRSLQKTGVRLREMITLVDHQGSIYRKHTNDYVGFACFDNRILYDRMRSNFEQHWQYAKPSMELRRLAI